MRYKAWPRVSTYQDTPSKRAALACSQQHQRDKLPLLAALIAEEQRASDTEMARRSVAWPQQQERARDRRAHDWRRARARLATQDQATR